MNKARIIEIIAGAYKILDLNTNEIYNSKPLGIFRINGKDLKVGDLVSYEKNNDSYIICDVYERINDLIRPNIANIEQALIIFSVKEPDLNLNLLDKFLITLEYHQINSIIVFNKYDLLNEKEIINIDKIISYYEQIGYTCIKTAAVNKQIDLLIPYLKNKISVFTGQSGVGKSSLLNAIDESLNLDTNVISKALGRGKHTTRTITYIPLLGGLIADTPGFGTISFKEMEPVDISHNFIEFFKLSKNCKFQSCLHLNEPGCAVKEAVNNNIVLKSRYENYLKFIEETRKEIKNDYSSINFKHKRRRTK